MIVEALVKERPDKLECLNPKRPLGRPIKALDLKHKGKKVMFITCWDDFCVANPDCKCECVDCSANAIPKDTMSKYPIPRDTCISCGCSDTIYIMVNEIFLG